MASKKANLKKAVKPTIGKKDEAPAAATESVKKEKKEKKEKVTKDTTPAVVDLASKQKSSILERQFYPETGTRFRANTAQQLAFDIIMAGAKNNKSSKDIRNELAATRKENGAARNLDSGYFAFVAASHPEFFEVWSNGDIKVKAEPQPNPDAVKAVKEQVAKKTTVAKKPEAGKAKPKMKPKAKTISKK